MFSGFLEVRLLWLCQRLERSKSFIYVNYLTCDLEAELNVSAPEMLHRKSVQLYIRFKSTVHVLGQTDRQIDR